MSPADDVTRSDSTPWLYDAEWLAFTRWTDGIQEIVYEESLDNPTSRMLDWAEANGLGVSGRIEARRNPVPGSYKQSEPPNAS